MERETNQQYIAPVVNLFFFWKLDVVLSSFPTADDGVTTINPDVKYAVRNPTRHPVYENFRTKIFAQILQSKNPDLEMLGELMYQSHSSYSSCGLGSEGTDRLVNLVKDCSKSSSGQTVK